MPSSIVDGCGLHPRGTGSAFPNAPLKSVSKGRNDFGTTCFAFATTCKVARLPDGSDPKGPTETFTPGLSTGRSPFPPPGITTMVAGRLHRQDLHLLEHQLASLQPPIIPYSGFSPVRLEGRYFRRAGPLTPRSSRRAVCLRPSCTPLLVSLFPRSKSRSAVRWYITVQAAIAALPQGSSLRSGLCCPGPSSLIDPMRPTRQHISISRTPLIRDALAVRPDCDA